MSPRIVLTLALALWFSLLALTASADPSLYEPFEASGPAATTTASYWGSTGLLLTPTAMVERPLKFSAFWHEVNTDPSNQTFIGLSVGLPFGFEVSGVRMQDLPPLPATPESFRDETILNAKYQVPLGPIVGNPLAPKVAIGVIDANNDFNRVIYVAASRSFTLTQQSNAALNVHLGWGNSNHGDARLDGFFGGVDLAPVPSVLLQAEYDAKNLNAGVRWYPRSWGSIDLGVVGNGFAWGATLRSDF
ncbi:MAG TPA: hypothetical protein VGM19_12860 [Armatimonadota bacterium]|jgi:hypothetical protein